jgi:hypothetical protein
MANSSSQHEYQIGDSVLVDMNGAQVPGVVEDTQGNQISVRLAEPWTDETGQGSESISVPADRLSPQVSGEPAGEQALPAPE